jgi:hypothetical protein
VSFGPKAIGDCRAYHRWKSFGTKNELTGVSHRCGV